MHLRKSIMLGVAVLALAGCGSRAVEDTEYVAATPDLVGVTLEINADSTQEGAKLVAESMAEYQAALGGTPEFLAGARAEVRRVNAALREAVGQVAELVKGDLVQAQPGDVLVYGPRSTQLATFRLQVKKVSATRFAWKLEARPLSSTEEAAWKVVATGGVGRTPEVALAHRGRGTLGVNLDSLKAVAPTYPGQGKLLASFAHTAGDDKVLSYRLLNFTPDTAQYEPLTGAFVGHRLLPSRATFVRVLGKWNFASSPTATKENAFATLRFRPGTGGRADVIASGGDIAADKVWIGSACWDAQEQEVFKIIRQCTKVQSGTPTNCTVVEQEGQRTACPAQDLRGEDTPPPEQPDNSAPGEGAPVQPEPVPADFAPEF
jgi:hypothetical protein